MRIKTIANGRLFVCRFFALFFEFYFRKLLQFATFEKAY